MESTRFAGKHYRIRYKSSDPFAFREGIRNGIAKINAGPAIRQPYERGVADSIEQGQENAYRATAVVNRNELQIEGSAALYAT